MKIHVYLLCFNEEKILPFILDYYTGFCSRVFVLDNESTDASVEICKNYNSVTVIEWGSNNSFDDISNLEMKVNTYKDYSRVGGKYTTEVADWVICADMDEVIYHPALIDLLKKYKRDGVTVPNIRGFNMVCNHWPSAGFNITESIRTGVRQPNFDKRAVFVPDFDIQYSPGCHPKGDAFKRMEESPNYKTSDSKEIALLHYKYLGDNFVRSAMKSKARLSKRNLNSGFGSQYLKDELELIKINKAMQESAIQVIDDNGNIIVK